MDASNGTTHLIQIYGDNVSRIVSRESNITRSIALIVVDILEKSTVGQESTNASQLDLCLAVIGLNNSNLLITPTKVEIILTQ